MEIKAPYKNDLKNFFLIILLVLVTGCIFSYTVRIRGPWFGTLSGHRQSSSATALIFTGNWYSEGAMNLKFAMLEIPDSVEYPKLSDRNHYFSYPPGALLPFYAMTKLMKTPPTLPLLMKYNLANQLLVAIFLSLTIYIFLLQIRLPSTVSFFFSFIPISAVLLLPAPLYWYQNTFIFLQAVIFPYVLYVFLEVLRDGSRKKRTIDVIQTIVFFYGIMTNWIFVFIALMVYLKRILSGEIKHTFFAVIRSIAVFWSPLFITVILLLGQIVLVGSSLSPLANSFGIRTGLISGGDSVKMTGSFYGHFWKDHIVRAYGEPAVLLFIMSLIIFLYMTAVITRRHIKKQRTDTDTVKTVFLTGIFLMPGLIYVYLFREWAAIHDVSVLYLIVPFATVPFVLIPVLFYVLFRAQRPSWFPDKFRDVIGKKASLTGTVLIITLLSVSLGYFLLQHRRFRTFFPVPNDSYRSIGAFIGGNTGYNDIVFSADYGDALFHPQLVYYSGKTIHKIRDLSDIFDVTDTVKGEYTIDIFSMDKDLVFYENGYWELNNGYENFHEGIKGLELISDEIIKKDGMYLYKIKPEVLRRFVKKQ